jgi:hypothetical protein
MQSRYRVEQFEKYGRPKRREMSSVRSLQEDQIRTWNDRDEASWVNLFSPEATFTAPGGVHGSGTEMARTIYHIWQDASRHPRRRQAEVAILDQVYTPSGEDLCWQLASAARSHTQGNMSIGASFSSPTQGVPGEAHGP